MGQRVNGHEAGGSGRQIKQIIVRCRRVCRQGVTQRLYEKVANPIPRVPRQVPDRVSIFRGRLFPQSRPHLVCGANGTAFIFCWLGKFPDSPTTSRSLLCDRGFSKETGKSNRLGNLAIGPVKPPSKEAATRSDAFLLAQ